MSSYNDQWQLWLTMHGKPRVLFCSRRLKREIIQAEQAIQKVCPGQGTEIVKIPKQKRKPK